jgi:hypothetical protein
VVLKRPIELNPSPINAAMARDHRMAAEIRAEAQGRTCGGCIHVRLFGPTGHCDRHVGYRVVGDEVFTSPLRINRENAVACRQWSAS